MEVERELVVLKDNERCTIKVCQTLSILHIVCKKHFENKELRQNLLEVMELIKAHKIRYFLGDVRSLHYMKMEDANWLSTTILPVMKICSLQKWARVENPNSMIELNSLQLKHKLEFEETCKHELQFESFVDEESALHWLLFSEE
ncbi:hypothetical protein [uncultured Pontibacter sp.]|uniref:hypothetical protein n=1 Tax=uncultured Pontibacter sp. TaxID=453356 RepID=UPI002622A7D9|nr:hypothetical protein [uncultured Pontibacter sp.]